MRARKRKREPTSSLSLSGRIPADDADNASHDDDDDDDDDNVDYEEPDDDSKAAKFPKHDSQPPERNNGGGGGGGGGAEEKKDERWAVIVTAASVPKVGETITIKNDRMASTIGTNMRITQYQSDSQTVELVAACGITETYHWEESKKQWRYIKEDHSGYTNTLWNITYSPPRPPILPPIQQPASDQPALPHPHRPDPNLNPPAPPPLPADRLAPPSVPAPPPADRPAAPPADRPADPPAARPALPLPADQPACPPIDEPALPSAPARPPAARPALPLPADRPAPLPADRLIFMPTDEPALPSAPAAPSAPVGNHEEKKSEKRGVVERVHWPTHPKSAYLFYFMKQRQSYVEAHPHVRQKDVMMGLSSQWKKIKDTDEAAPYKELAAADQRRYNEQRTNFKNQQSQSDVWVGDMELEEEEVPKEKGEDDTKRVVELELKLKESEGALQLQVATLNKLQDELKNVRELHSVLKGDKPTVLRESITSSRNKRMADRDYTSAIQLTKFLHDLFPEDSKSNNEKQALAKCYALSKQPKLALEVLHSIPVDLRCYANWFYLGFAEGERKDHLTAIEFYSKAIEMYAEEGEAFENRMNQYLRCMEQKGEDDADMLEKALEDGKKAAKLYAKKLEMQFEKETKQSCDAIKQRFANLVLKKGPQLLNNADWHAVQSLCAKTQTKLLTCDHRRLLAESYLGQKKHEFALRVLLIAPDSKQKPCETPSCSHHALLNKIFRQIDNQTTPGATPSSSDADAKGPSPSEGECGSLCVVCLTEPVNWLLMPCAHLCCCGSCLGEIRKYHRDKPSPLCPICCAPFTTVIKTFR